MYQVFKIASICVFLVACADNTKQLGNASDNENHSPIHSSNSARSEMEIQGDWQGKHVKELVKEYGKPDSVINTTLLGGPASEGYVYAQNRSAGNSSCINVYVVGMSNNIILKYFCR